MDNTIEQVQEEHNKVKTINLKFTKKAHSNVKRLQKQFIKRTGGKINQQSLINTILETATL